MGCSWHREGRPRGGTIPRAMTNAEIARVFREIAQLLDIKGESVFRVRAYERAAENIDKAAEDVADLAARGELSRIPGIGKGLTAHIGEYLGSGTIAELEALRKEIPAGLLSLLDVRGLGPKTAKLLYDRLGI